MQQDSLLYWLDRQLFVAEQKREQEIKRYKESFYRAHYWQLELIDELLNSAILTDKEIGNFRLRSIDCTDIEASNIIREIRDSQPNDVRYGANPSKTKPGGLYDQIKWAVLDEKR